MEESADTWKFRPIGYMKSVFQYKNGTPRQSGICSSAVGVLDIEKSVFNNPEHSLEGLEQFSHIWVLFIFHKNNNSYTKAKVRPPRLNGKRVGLFSTRCPYRPNPIGLTLAKLDKVQGSQLYISGIDILDGTPILDVKPFIQAYDCPSSQSKFDIAQYEATIAEKNSSAIVNKCSEKPKQDGTITCNSDTWLNDSSQMHGNSTGMPSVSGLVELCSCDSAIKQCTTLDKEHDDGQSINTHEEFTKSPDNMVTRETLRPENENIDADSDGMNRLIYENISLTLDHTQSCVNSPCSHSVCRSSTSRYPDHIVYAGKDGGNDCTAAILSDNLGKTCDTGNQRLANKNVNCLGKDGDASIQSSNNYVSEQQDTESDLVKTKSDCNKLTNEILLTSREHVYYRIKPGSPKYDSSSQLNVSTHMQNMLCETPRAPKIDIADWISRPSVSNLSVSFTRKSQEQLLHFNPNSENDDFKLNLFTTTDALKESIEHLLTEDPRSTYRRSKCKDSLYYFTVDNVHVTCWFDDRVHGVEVIRLQPLAYAIDCKPNNTTNK